MSEPSVLMVPVHIDALVLRQDRAVVDALADFTRLPYSDGRRDVNSDIGYLSEAILTDPFANQSLRLPAGVTGTAKSESDQVMAPSDCWGG